MLAARLALWARKTGISYSETATYLFVNAIAKSEFARLIMNIEFEELTHQNFSDACNIDRDDIPEAFVDTASTIMDITDYGIKHNCIGYSFVVKYNEKPIGLILLGEAIH